MVILGQPERENNHCTKLVIFANILKQALQKVPFISLQKEHLFFIGSFLHWITGDFSHESIRKTVNHFRRTQYYN